MLYLFAVLRCIITSMTVVKSETLPQQNGMSVRSESDLRKYIFRDYDKLVRPVKDPATPVKVELSFTPFQINEVDVKNQVIKLDGWILMKWNDENFEWNPKDFGNISALRIPAEEIWRPDVSIYTATPNTALYPFVLTRAVAYHKKSVLWVPYVSISSRCPMLNMGDKNTLECNIRIGSWTYDSNLMDLQLASDQVDLKNFQDINPDWKLVKMGMSWENKHYDCCSEAYPVIHLNVTLQKRHPFKKFFKNDVKLRPEIKW